MKTIFLCGFMGCGKTTIGKRLSSKYDLSFIDLDDYIVQKEKMTVPQIFSLKGEPYFRKAEAEALRETAEKYNVIATGGGTILNEVSAKTAADIGITIFIDTDFETCYERIKNDANRPLAVNNSKDRLMEIYNERRSVYIKNSCISISGSVSADSAAEKIIEISK